LRHSRYQPWLGLGNVTARTGLGLGTTALQVVTSQLMMGGQAKCVMSSEMTDKQAKSCTQHTY